MKVNGTQIDQAVINESWKDNKICLDPALLKDKVSNILEFSIDNSFNSDQFGMILVKDPSGESYCYIQTVPYYANRVVPIFDQPDLKGRFAIAVTHHKNNLVITTGELANQFFLKEYLENPAYNDWLAHSAKLLRVQHEEAMISIFETSPFLSSYLLNLVCGPFCCISDPQELEYRGIHLRIFCRSKTPIHL